MNADDLKTLALELEPLVSHVDYLQRIARPCIDIDVVDDAPTPRCSRFGGDPLGPPAFQWPASGAGEYRFLGQINFAEFVDPSSRLPRTGLLSLFFLDDEEGEAFWGDEGFIVGYYWENIENFRILRSPGSRAVPDRRLRLTAGLSLPRNRELREDWPADDEFEECLFDELPAKAGVRNDHLLGYPHYYSLAYDPTPGRGWVPLLTLDSNDEFGWSWHDSAMLMVFVEEDRLAERDFSNLVSDAG